MTEIQDKTSYIKGLAWLVAAFGIAALFAYGLSPFVRSIPWSWEKNLAHIVQPIPPSDVCIGNPRQQALLKQLVGRLYPLGKDDTRFSIDVRIANNSNINAFAELGGNIFLNRGLLEKAQSPEEVAGVLAHEITHVSRRHILEGFIVRLMTFEGLQMLFGGSASSAQWASLFINMSFTRTQEAEADQGALLRLQKAHINNRGFGQFFERLKELASSPDFLSDHPSSESRLEMVKNYQNYNTRPIMTDEDWKIFKAYCQ